MLWYILIGLAALVTVLIVVIATRPGEFRVARAATMSAAPEAVFAQVNDFHKWEEQGLANIKSIVEGTAKPEIVAAN
jgi:hypothetical protein